eukprot:8815708-Pyramimonas_sp.AAC.1
MRALRSPARGVRPHRDERREHAPRRLASSQPEALLLGDLLEPQTLPRDASGASTVVDRAAADAPLHVFEECKDEGGKRESEKRMGACPSSLPRPW